MDLVFTLSHTELIAFFTAIGALMATVAKLSWDLKSSMQNILDKTQVKLDDHEEKDQGRHLDNVEKFAKIETKLDILLKNGH